MRTLTLSTLLTLALPCQPVWAQGPPLFEYELAEARDCFNTYSSSVERQDDCFNRKSLLRSGRTPDQIRAYLADPAAQEQQRLAQEEQRRKLQEDAQAARQNRCIAERSVPASEVALVREQKIQLGMSEAALWCSWGDPQRVNRSVGSWGEHKQYIYSGANVYVENGKVTSWQD